MKTMKFFRISGIVLSALLIFGAMTVQAQGRSRATDFSRFSMSLGGGFSSSEDHRGLLNLGAEMQMALSSRLRLGLGVGYLNSLRGHNGDMDRGYNNQGGGMMNGRQGMGQKESGSFGWNDQMNGPGNQFRVVPVSLNIYYLVPVGRKWNVYAGAGASYNFGSFREGTLNQHKRAMGGQAGLGVEFRLADRLRLVAEGGYRFLEFHKLSRPEPPLNPLAQLLGIWTTGQPRTGDNDRNGWMNFINALLKQSLGIPMQPQEKYYDLNLNGFTCRMAVKFGF